MTFEACIHSASIFTRTGPTSIAPPLSGSFRQISLNVVKDEAKAPTASSASRVPPSGPFFDPSALTSLPSSSFVFRPHPPHPHPESNPSAFPSRSRTPSPDAPESGVASDPDPLPRTPSAATLAVFYDHYANWLPYLTAEDLRGRVEGGTASEVLLNAMAALAERARPSRPDYGNGARSLPERYADRAKKLLLPHLALPSLDMVISLNLLAIHEFGEDRDSGLWLWLGM